MDDQDRHALREAAENLSRAAKEARARLDSDSEERRFLLGIDAAALEILHPELAEAHTEGWLDLCDAPFLDGYLRTRAAFAAAATADPTPTHVRMPDPTVAAGG